MKILKPLAVVGICLFILLLGAFAFRQSLLLRAFKAAAERVRQTYHLELSASNIRFTGINKIAVANLTLQPEGADTLLTIRSAELSIAVGELLKGRINFSEIKLNGLTLSVYNTVERNNLSFIKKPGIQKASADSLRPANYKETLERVEKKFILALNTAFEIEDFHLNYLDSTRLENIYSPEISYDLKHLSGIIINRQMPDTFQIAGRVLDKDKKYEFNVQHMSSGSSYIPFLDSEKGIKCRFQSISGNFELDKNRDELLSTFDLDSKNFHLNYWRLAKGDVIFPSAQLKGTLRVSNQSMQLDSSTSLSVNHTGFQLFANYNHDTSTNLILQAHMPETIADTFFHALPAAAFNALDGISCSGTLAYDLQFVINTAQPDSLKFLSTLTRKNLHINHYGEENFERVNSPFTYYAYNGEQPVRQIEIGPGNPLFTPINRINPLLIKCVLQSEDPSFMTHRGFLPESFRESIAQDYKEKRFARGGSTISMQFVKNVFLSRDKTVTRKVQEALIVYLIENLGLISKERMLEIYLNVIEWGPNVYGIGEASKFYFNKKPSELSFNECLFLAAIIPNPKYFRYQFDKDGHVKSYMTDYFKLLSTRMAKRNLISDEELQELVPDVKLTGPAKQLVTPVDTIPVDEELPGVE